MIHHSLVAQGLPNLKKGDRGAKNHGVRPTNRRPYHMTFPTSTPEVSQDSGTVRDMPVRQSATTTLAFVIAALLGAGCGTSTSGPAKKAASRTTTTTIRTAAGSTSTTTTFTPASQPPASSVQTTTTLAEVRTAAGPLVANGNGWTAQGLEGSVPPAGSCHYGHDGTWVLPDPACTPGSITPLVTSSNLSSTICRYGYSASVRPPESLTEPEKFALMQAYGDTGSPSQYEFDHLIPLELGGSSNLANLWPEPNQGSPSTFNSYASYGLNAKDGVESQSNYAVCDRGYPLALAQREMASDWVLAHQQMPN